MYLFNKIIFLKDEARDGVDIYQHDNHVFFEKKKVYRGDLSKNIRV